MSQSTPTARAVFEVLIDALKYGNPNVVAQAVDADGPALHFFDHAGKKLPVVVDASLDEGALHFLLSEDITGKDGVVQKHTSALRHTTDDLPALTIAIMRLLDPHTVVEIDDAFEKIVADVIDGFRTDMATAYAAHNAFVVDAAERLDADEDGMFEIGQGDLVDAEEEAKTSLAADAANQVGDDDAEEMVDLCEGIFQDFLHELDTRGRVLVHVAHFGIDATREAFGAD